MKYLILCLLLACISSKGNAAMNTLVPKSIAGWKSEGGDGTYNRKNLYDYIDGEAEVYLAYAFREAFTRGFVQEGRPAITVDLFDMGSSSDAYGIFSFERESGDVDIGTDSEYSSGLLRFWKGNYFVSSLADQETPESTSAVMSLGSAIASSIKEAGERPKIIGLLPEQGLNKISIRYLHVKPSFDYQYYLWDKNILNLSPKTEVVLAKYQDGSRLMLVRYPQASQAQAASKALKGSTPKLTASELRGALLIAVFEGPSKEMALSLIKSVKMEVAK
jgi:hypothetical protein